jgi:hypothetical protein
MQESPGREPWVRRPTTTEPCKGEASCVALAGLNLRQHFRPRAQRPGLSCTALSGLPVGESGPLRLATLFRACRSRWISGAISGLTARGGGLP